MSSVLEIEKAIEELPLADLRQLFTWMEEKQSLMAASAKTFELYDAEEEEGLQWQD
jgi:hypothetical protein